MSKLFSDKDLVTKDTIRRQQKVSIDLSFQIRIEEPLLKDTIRGSFIILHI